MIILLLVIGLAVHKGNGEVLDPAMYLMPSPPLVITSGSVQPGELWTQPMKIGTERITRDVSQITENVDTTTKPEAAESRMFWPRFNSPQPALGIHIPLTFSLSGSYGKASSIPAGVIGNTYTSVTGLGTSLTSGLFGKSVPVSGVLGKSSGGVFGRSGLAGSSYGTYGSVRVYGNDNVAAWGGWGNGKWGHYGKG